MHNLGRIFGMSMILLSACGTPQEQCIARSAQPLRTVDQLIAEVQGNLDRGYALREVAATRSVWRDCVRASRNKQGQVKLVESLCLEDEATIVEKPAAIDPAEERRKLAALVEHRRQLAATVARASADCRAQFPE